jgi:hypothetical protein
MSTEISYSRMKWGQLSNLRGMSYTIKETPQGIPVMLYVDNDYVLGKGKGLVYAIPLGVHLSNSAINYQFNAAKRTEDWADDFTVELVLEDEHKCERHLLPSWYEENVRRKLHITPHKLVHSANPDKLESLDFNERYTDRQMNQDGDYFGSGRAYAMKINVYQAGKLISYQPHNSAGKIHPTYLKPSIFGTVRNITQRSFEVHFPELTGGGFLELPLDLPLFPRFVKKQPASDPNIIRVTAIEVPASRHSYGYDQPRFTPVKVMSKPTLWKAVLTHCVFEKPEDRAELALRAALLSLSEPAEGDATGLHRVKKYLAAVNEHDPLVGSFLHAIMSKKKQDGVSRNDMIRAQIEATPDPKDFCQLIRSMAETMTIVKFADEQDYNQQLHEFVSDFMSSAELQEKRQEAEARAKEQARALKAKSLIEKVDGMAILQSKYPLLHAALVSGEIPPQVFSQPKARSDAPDQPVNRELVLWEEALAQPGWRGPVLSVATNAAGRKSFDRDVTPWLNFMLYMLPAYLDKHAPRPNGGKWKCRPVHVQGAWELERDTETNENGTSKRRSAMTPVANNETGEVTVPYVAMVVHGFQDQYCYSKHYWIFTKGMTDPESGGIVLNDLEEKLNGRDDYGLMYYDLNGTVTATGYPTFLIIFERKAKGTHVHFHRVRPCRSVNGVKTPAMELVAACYQYMAGNIPAEAVVAQQGDLILLNAKHDPTVTNAKLGDATLGGSDASKGFVFESHRFVGAEMCFFASDVKEPNNRLGFIFAPQGVYLDHPEHDPTEKLPAGWYEIRRAKTWEANPRGIWRGFAD